MSKPHTMTARALQAWLDCMGWNPKEAGKQLDLSRSTMYAYLNGSTPIPQTVAFACQHLKTLHCPPEPQQLPAEPPGSMDPIYFRPVIPKMSSNR